MMRAFGTCALLLGSLPRAADGQTVTFAKCDSSDPRQVWCVSRSGEVKDSWGRCLTRHDCTVGNAAGTDVSVGTCGAQQCSGSQSWIFAAPKIAVNLPGACPKGRAGTVQDFQPIKDQLCQCLDISVGRNVAQTYPCKKHYDKFGKGYCGDSNQDWELKDDGTLAVPVQPQVICPKIIDDSQCKDPSKGKNPCGPACLVAPEPGADAKTLQSSGGTCLNQSYDLGGQLVALLLLGALLYLGGGIGINKARGNGHGWRELLPHQTFWRNAAALVLDGVAFSRGSRRERDGGGLSSAMLVDEAGSSTGGRRRTGSESGGSKHSKGSKGSKGAKKKKGSSKETGQGKDKGKEQGKTDEKGESPPDRTLPRDGRGAQAAAGAGGAVGWSGNAAELQEERDASVHSSQAKIKVVV
jgi:hypothetical protein